MRRATIADTEEDFVAVEHLVHRLDRFRDNVLHVLQHPVELAAMDAALGVDRVVDHAHGVGVVDALHGGDTGQILHGAEGDLGVRHPAGRGVGTPDNGGCREQPSGSGQDCAAGYAPCFRHEISSLPPPDYPVLGGLCGIL